MRTFVFLAVLSISSVAWGKQIKAPLCGLKETSTHVLGCDRNNPRGECVIRMDTLDCLEGDGDKYVIAVRRGETVVWLGNRNKRKKTTCPDYDLSGCPKIHFAPFKPHVKDAICGQPDNSNPPFTNKFDKDVDSQGNPNYESTKRSKVSSSVSAKSCFSHNVTMNDGETIDPHIMIEDILLGASNKSIAKKQLSAKRK